MLDLSFRLLKSLYLLTTITYGTMFFPKSNILSCNVRRTNLKEFHKLADSQKSYKILHMVGTATGTNPRRPIRGLHYLQIRKVDQSVPSSSFGDFHVIDFATCHGCRHHI